MTSMTQIENAAKVLRYEWEEARRELDQRSESDWLATQEQDAWDALVDFVEANNLNHTEFDPRI